MVAPAGAVVVDVGCGGRTRTRAWHDLGAAMVLYAELERLVDERGRRLPAGPLEVSDRWTIWQARRPA